MNLALWSGRMEFDGQYIYRMTSKLGSSDIRQYFLNELMFSYNLGDSRKNIYKMQQE